MSSPVTQGRRGVHGGGIPDGGPINNKIRDQQTYLEGNENNTKMATKKVKDKFVFSFLGFNLYFFH